MRLTHLYSCYSAGQLYSTWSSRSRLLHLIGGEQLTSYHRLFGLVEERKMPSVRRYCKYITCMKVDCIYAASKTSHIVTSSASSLAVDKSSSSLIYWESLRWFGLDCDRRGFITTMDGNSLQTGELGTSGSCGGARHRITRVSCTTAVNGTERCIVDCSVVCRSAIGITKRLLVGGCLGCW
jgi:hypothetical protein